MLFNIPDDICQLMDEVKPYLDRYGRFIDDTPKEIKDKLEIVLKWYDDNQLPPGFQ